MAILNGYCTVDELARKMGLDALKTTAHETQLEEAIEDASRYIDLQTDSVFFNKVITSEILEVCGVSESGFYITPCCRFIVASAPILAATEVKENGIILTRITTFGEIGDFYVKQQTGLIVKSNGIWSKEPLAITFTGNIGYAETPKDIREFCLTLASLFTRLDNRIVTDGEGNSLNILSSSIPKWVQNGLKRRRKAIV